MEVTGVSFENRKLCLQEQTKIVVPVQFKLLEWQLLASSQKILSLSSQFPPTITVYQGVHITITHIAIKKTYIKDCQRLFSCLYDCPRRICPSISMYVILSACLSISLSVHQPVCPSAVCPSACLSISLSVHQPVCPSACLSISLCVHQPVCPSVGSSICPSVSLFTDLYIKYLSIWLFVCLSIYLSVHFWSDHLCVCPSVRLFIIKRQRETG